VPPKLALPDSAIGSDVKDISSKGLLPQLTDVLHALTDSHELLLFKLQSVRLGHLNAVPLEIEAFPHAEFLDFVDTRQSALADTKTGATHDVHRNPADTIESSTEATGRPFIASDVSPRFAAAAAQADPETSAQPPATTEAVTPRVDIDAAVPAQAPTPPEWPLAVQSDSNGSESAKDSYNFFDELDARLADLGHPESGSGEN
jgi:hypothetical protein